MKRRGKKKTGVAVETDAERRVRYIQRLNDFVAHAAAKLELEAEGLTGLERSKKLRRAVAVRSLNIPLLIGEGQVRPRQKKR